MLQYFANTINLTTFIKKEINKLKNKIMKLKVGDKVYRCYRGNPVDVKIVERTTKTLAISGVYRFKINYYENRWIELSGHNSGYSAYSYYIESPELIAKFDRNKLLNRAKEVSLNDLTNDQLKIIIDFKS